MEYQDKELESKLSHLETLSNLQGWTPEQTSHHRNQIALDHHLTRLNAIEQALGKLADKVSFAEARMKLLEKYQEQDG